MEFLLLLSAVTLVLGTVNCACNEDDRNKCKTRDEATFVPGMADACRKVNLVRVCVLSAAGCDEKSANDAATEIDNEKKLNCKTSDPKWENEGRCITKEYLCEDAYTKTIQEIKNKDKDKICAAIGVFQECLKSECVEAFISQKISTFMKREVIDRCENIAIATCTDMLKYENCLNAFVGAKIQLDLGKDTETQCMLANAVERCFRKEAMCETETTRRTIGNMLQKLDCSEYVDLCNHREEEVCNTRHPNPGTCENLKEYRSCLQSNDTCPPGRVHHILRIIMDEKKWDCEDVDTCEHKKEGSCDVDVGVPTKTNEEKCKRLKDYEKCMVRANCNEKYMDSKIVTMKGELGNPCGASSIMASIGLTLLLAAFTGQWK